MAEPARDYRGFLARFDLTPTPRRLMVLEIIGNSSSPLSAREIFATIRRSQGMNRVTLYRILDLLVEKQLVERISSGDRSFRYALAADAGHVDHAHFYCCHCGNMECLERGALNLDVQSFQRAFPALIQKVEIRLDGICKDCLRREKNERRE